jgi:hypothetical protein
MKGCLKALIGFQAAFMAENTLKSALNHHQQA